MKKTGYVRHKVDFDAPVVLTAEQEARLRALAALPDDQIDYSDAPPSPDDPNRTPPRLFREVMAERAAERAARKKAG